MVLVSLDTLRSLIETDLTDDALTLLAEDAEAEIVDKFGPHATDGDVSERFPAGYGAALFLSRRAQTVTSVVQVNADSTTTNLAASYYRFEGDGSVQLLSGVYALWVSAYPLELVVSYTPKDDTARRKRVIVDLVRLAAQYNATSLTVLGDTRVMNVEYESERGKILDRLARGIASFE